MVQSLGTESVGQESECKRCGNGIGSRRIQFFADRGERVETCVSCAPASSPRMLSHMRPEQVGIGPEIKPHSA